MTHYNDIYQKIKGTFLKVLDDTDGQELIETIVANIEALGGASEASVDDHILTMVYGAFDKMHNDTEI